MGIVTKWRAGNNTRSYRMIFLAGNTIRAAVSSDGSDEDAVDTTDTFTGTSVWQHFAFTWDASASQFEIYVDGAANKSGTGSLTGVHDNASRLGVGGLDQGSDTPTSPLDGLIDEVRVWSDIRTGTEISNNFDKELTGGETGLVAYYKLNNASTDATSNGNNLTLLGAPVFSLDVPFGGLVNQDYAYFM
jgi:hypothetical protein